MTLADFVSNLGDNQFGFQDVLSLLRKIATYLKKLHKRRINHRDLTMDKIKISSPSEASQQDGSKLSTITKIKIGGFDLAFCFEKNSYEV